MFASKNLVLQVIQLILIPLEVDRRTNIVRFLGAYAIPQIETGMAMFFKSRDPKVVNYKSMLIQVHSMVS